MDHRITATELARRLGDVLGRVRYRGDAFVVERNGEPVARLTPVAGSSATSLREALAAWDQGERDTSFADDLERVSQQDRAPEPAWES
jgi:prevent-host-death family protein